MEKLISKIVIVTLLLISSNTFGNPFYGKKLFGDLEVIDHTKLNESAKIVITYELPRLQPFPFPIKQFYLTRIDFTEDLAVSSSLGLNLNDIWFFDFSLGRNENGSFSPLCGNRDLAESPQEFFVLMKMPVSCYYYLRDPVVLEKILKTYKLTLRMEDAN